MQRRYIPVAEISRPHGIRGELRLKLFHEDSDLLSQRPHIRLQMPDGQHRDIKLAAIRAANKGLIATFAGIVDRNGAEELRGALLCVPRDEFPPAEDGEFYACDVEGARAVLVSGDEIGRVLTLDSYPSCDALVIDRGARGRIEIPLIDQYVDSIDIEQGIVRIRSLDGIE